ncbi:flagellar hook basal-body protein [Ruficoccus amylovorans]|uniref:Flagellar hook basal-body protein n=1 Tax=Ruficoccus amylovorans TaxID=1804625 RepID=A0A842HFP0_9BACT|nr:flagellar hook basal-body protein [Ruficoccus amylovorans]MBC2595030.1 flagellar hook basal-body protein [Ruficoccus amylovorans]
MNIGLHTGAYRLYSLERYQQVLATNLANLTTPGYRPETFVVEGKALEADMGANAPQALLPMHTLTRITEGPSPMRATGSPYDFALEDGSFFAVQDGGGKTLYTRDGEFHINADGFLVNKFGYKVLGDGGPLEIPPDGAVFSVSRDGAITVNDELVGKLRVTDFKNPDALLVQGGGFFSDASGQAGAFPVEYPSVVQGSLAGSQVQPMQEMVGLIDAARSYELIQKLIEEGDQRAQQAIRTFSE